MAGNKTAQHQAVDAARGEITRRLGGATQPAWLSLKDANAAYKYFWSFTKKRFRFKTFCAGA